MENRVLNFEETFVETHSKFLNFRKKGPNFKVIMDSVIARVPTRFNHTPQRGVLKSLEFLQVFNGRDAPHDGAVRHYRPNERFKKKDFVFKSQAT